MNRKESYEKSVNILLDAYNNDTLKHNDCTACAVGNLIKGSGYKFKGKKIPLIVAITRDPKLPRLLDLYNENDTQWLRLIGRDVRDEKYPICDIKEDVAKEQLSHLEYTLEEVSRIEHAFESTNGYYDVPEKERQFLGLTAVLKVLEKIHNTEQPESQKRLETIAKDKYLVEV